MLIRYCSKNKRLGGAVLGKYIVGITGASGSIYGKWVVEELVKLGHQVYLVVTEQGEKVFCL